MTENLNIWNKFSQPPKTALKQIGAGRLKGKHDINPQWRYKAMTEVFGQVGIGWKYTVDRTWTESVANGEILAFVQISLYTRNGSEWSDAIPAMGGSTLVANEKSGLYNSDEAYKMATTDALGVAMKMLGVAADIYMGLFDGTKYANQSSEPARKSEPMTLDRAKVTRDSKGGLYSDKSVEELQKVIDTPAAPEDKKAAARLLIEEKNKEGK
jgi:hypothetical protein